MSVLSSREPVEEPCLRVSQLVCRINLLTRILGACLRVLGVIFLALLYKQIPHSKMYYLHS